MNLRAQYYFAKAYDQFTTGIGFIQTSDSGFVILTNDKKLLKIDKNGELLWHTTSFYQVSASTPFSFHETQDSSIIIAYNRTNINSKFEVYKFDKYGNLIFNKSYLISEGYSEFSCYGTFLRNDTLVAIVSENDSIIETLQISVLDGDTISKLLLFNINERFVGLRVHKNKYNDSFNIYTRWYNQGIVAENYTLYKILSDYIIVDSAKVYYPSGFVQRFSDLNNNDKYLFQCSSGFCLQYFQFPLGTPYFDSTYAQLNIHNIIYSTTSFISNFLISGRETLIDLDNMPKGMLCKVDENGNILFRKQYTIDNHVQAYFRYADFGDDYIMAVGALQETTNSPTKLFIVKTDLNGNVTSVPSHGLAANVKVFPNPATDKLYVDMPKDAGGFAHYEIFDLQGRLLADGKLHGNSIDVSGFSQGVYILSAEIAGFRYCLKWVKN